MCVIFFAADESSKRQIQSDDLFSLSAGEGLDHNITTHDQALNFFKSVIHNE